MNLRALSRQYNQGLTDKEAYRKARADLIETALQDGNGDDTTGIGMQADTTQQPASEAGEGEPEKPSAGPEASAEKSANKPEATDGDRPPTPEQGARPARAESRAESPLAAKDAVPGRDTVRPVIIGALVVGVLLIAAWFVFA